MLKGVLDRWFRGWWVSSALMKCVVSLVCSDPMRIYYCLEWIQIWRDVWGRTDHLSQMCSNMESKIDKVLWVRENMKILAKMWKPVDQHVEEWGQEEITDGKDIIIRIILIIMIIIIIIIFIVIIIIITWRSVALRRVKLSFLWIEFTQNQFCR